MTKGKPKLVFRLATADNCVARMIIKAGHEVTTSSSKFDCLVLNGGADINPFIYGQKKHPRTHPVAFRRDLHELKLIKSLPKSFPKLGICRGGQLLNCLSGGSLWQDVDNHTGGHEMWDLLNNRVITVSSIHHQMMKPAEDAIVLGCADVSTYREDDESRYEFSKDNKNDWDDPEILYYSDTNSLCIQGHPEYGTYHEFTDLCWDLVYGFLFKAPPDEIAANRIEELMESA